MKFSILTACRNNREFLDDYFKSVLSQANVEVIFVDDASTDGSFEFAQSKQDDRLKLIRNPVRQFCSGSYATALSHATGEICGVVDADDVLAADAVAKVVEQYEKHPEIGYIYTQHYWCDKSLKVQRRGVSGLPKKTFVDNAKLNRPGFSHWRTFRRELSSQAVIFPPGLKYAVDKQMGFVLEEIAVGGFFLQPLYYYRYHPSNMSLTASVEQRRLSMELAQSFALRRRSFRVAVKPVRVIQ